MEIEMDQEIEMEPEKTYSSGLIPKLFKGIAARLCSGL